VGNNLNKDNLLFLLGGLVLGFIFAFLMFEAMASRQPPRLTAALRSQIAMGDETAGGGGAMGAAEAPPGAAQGGGPAMAEIQQLREVVEKNPNDIQAVRKLADLNFDIQNWQRAQELYSHYLELKPNDPDVITDLGITYRGLQQYDKAIDLFNQAKKLEPGHWQAYYNEVVVLAFDLKKPDQANQVMGQLQKLQPGNPEVARLAEAMAKQRAAA
jgi:tetratricopeptide (TPR) repeat protein